MSSVDDPIELVERSADGKGRVTIGADYAGETVRVAILDVVSRGGGDLEDTQLWSCPFCQALLFSDDRPDHCPDCREDGADLDLNGREVHDLTDD